MSTTFFLEDINNKGSITVRQLLEIGQLSQYDVDEDDESYEEYLDTKIDEIEFLLLGQEGASARGFEFSFDADSNCYCIRAFSPCSTGDFGVIFNFIRDLGNFLRNATVTTDYDDEYTINNIEEYPYYEHIMAGLEQSMEVFKRTSQHTIEVYGIHRPVSFDEKMFTEIMESDDPVEQFSEFITDIQNIDAFTANQNFFQAKDGSIIGAYSITETVTTVLPYEPRVGYQYARMVRNEDVRWEISLVGIDGDPDDNDSYNVIGRMLYSDFIANLPKDKYKLIDANQILVEALSREDMEEILGK